MVINKYRESNNLLFYSYLSEKKCEKKIKENLIQFHSRIFSSNEKDYSFQFYEISKIREESTI